MHKSFLKLLTAAVVVASLLTSVPTAFAQGITTSALNGLVSSKEGQPLGGATVTVVHEPSGTRAVTTTRANGQYNFTGLRVGGPYSVVISAPGYTPENVNDVYLDLGEAGVVNSTLGSEVLQLEKLSVTASRDGIFDSGKIGTGTTMSDREIENVSTVRRNIQDIAVLDSRLALMSLDQGGQLSAQGQNFRFNSFTVDGVQAIDPFGLNSNGFSSLRSPIPLEAIQSFSADLTPYDVRRAGAVGAYLNAVIKSGTNEYKGVLYYEMTNESLRAKNPVTGVKDAFDERAYGFAVGGPIIKNKLFFFIDYDDWQRKTAAPSANFIPDTAASGSSGQVAAIVARATALGYDAGTLNGENVNYQKTTIAKIDWNVSDQHRATFTYRKNDGQDVVFASYNGSTTTSLSNFWYAQPRVTNSYNGQVFSQWTPDFRTEATVSYTKYDGSPANNGSPFPQVQIQGITGTRLDQVGSTNNPTGTITNGAIFLGTESSRQLNQIITKEKLGRFTADYSIGDHTITAGIEEISTKYDNAFVQYTNGYYIFPTLAAWQAGTPVSGYTLQKANTGFTISDAVARWSYDAYSIFIQDSWKPTSQLTLLAGLRYDYPDIPNAPKTATGFDTAGFTRDDGVTAVTRNDTTNSGNATMAPRIGFTYKFKTENKTQIRGGLGLFQGKNPAVWISNAYSNAGATGAVGVSNSSGIPNFSFVADPTAQIPPTGNPPAPNINITDPKFKQPASWKGNLALDHKLPFGNITFTAEFSYIKTSQALHYEFLNYLKALTGPQAAPDARIRYNGLVTPAGTMRIEGITTIAQAQAAFGTAAINTSTSATSPGSFFGSNANNVVFNSASSNNTTGTFQRRRVTTGGPTGSGFGDVYYLTNSDKGEYTGVTLQLARPMKDHWSWSASYTRSDATEVAPVTSSVAGSNYGARAVFNPNEDVASTSNTNIKDRIVISVAREFEFIKKFKTTVAAVYQGRTGHPYSWVFYGDANGDGFTFQDLLYVPTGPSDPKVTWASTTERDAFFAFAQTSGLAKYAGTYTPRNSEVSPWQQTIDLKFIQQIPVYGKMRAELYVNLLNFWNLIDDNWGLQEEVPFSYKRAVAGATYNATGNGGLGSWVYTFNSTTLNTVPTTVNDTDRKSVV